jgi:hypothetical protein
MTVWIIILWPGLRLFAASVRKKTTSTAGGMCHACIILTPTFPGRDFRNP